MSRHYTIGLDFGTNSVRALVVDVSDGRELGSSIWEYQHGQAGILLDSADPDLARQHPADYVTGIEKTIIGALQQASQDQHFSSSRVIGIGVDTTGSTPIPVDQTGTPLGLNEQFQKNLHAMVWLWKDHTSHAEAEQLTQTAAHHRPHYLAKCGGRYSSEWFWAKILRCARVAPEVFDAAYTWVELADWIPALLTGSTNPVALKRSICAAGHKAFFNQQWGGYPDVDFLSQLDPRLARVRQTLPDRAWSIAESAGGLTSQWASRLGLPAGIPVAIGAFDAHLGAVGAGIGTGTLVKIIGTSTCDIMVSPMKQKLADIPGLCGIVPESVLPEYFGLEAGQSAVGDIFNWFVKTIQPGGASAGSHEALTAGAEKLSPGESGLLALDWMNGNRTVLVDQRLTGLIVGLTLASTPAEIYRALLEATAMGARVIIERLEKYDVPVQRIVNCGGIAARSPLTMQIYADVTNRPIAISRSTQTCALGAAMAGAVVAGQQHGGYNRFEQAIGKMTAVQSRTFQPDPARAAIYEKLYQLYLRLHDAFGIAGHTAQLSDVMKELLIIRDAALASKKS